MCTCAGFYELLATVLQVKIEKRVCGKDFKTCKLGYVASCE